MLLASLVNALQHEKEAYLANAKNNPFISLAERTIYIDGLERATEIVCEYNQVLEDKIAELIKEKEDHKAFWSDYLISHKSEMLGIREVLNMLMAGVVGHEKV